MNVKLDDSNYLNWQFQMQLLLEGHMGFVDGSNSCPTPFVHHFNEWSLENNGANSSS